MKPDIDKIFIETLRLYTGMEGLEALGGTSVKEALPGTLSEKIAAFFESVGAGKPDTGLLPVPEKLHEFAEEALTAFPDFYKNEDRQKISDEKTGIIFNSEEAVETARVVSELWSPELLMDDDTIFNSWKLYEVRPNPGPYKPNEILIQLNALYAPANKTAPRDIDQETAEAYNLYMKSNPKKIAVYDHPVPVFTRGNEHELEKCLSEMDDDIAFEKKSGIFPADDKLRVLVSVSTTHSGLDEICEKWLGTVIRELRLEHITCYLLSENKARNLENFLGNKAEIFTVQGKYACHFGALKYAQLIFEKAFGTRAGFKLDTDEGIHSENMKKVSGKTWLEQLCHPFWGGTAMNDLGQPVTLGFNIGEYVDSRDLDTLGYARAIHTPEVKTVNDVRGPYLIFNKGVCQAKGTMLLNRTEKLEDFISHPLVKGGGYGIDNNALRKAVPVGFSMVGRAEDQQFYFSAVNSGVQGIFNPLLRIIHYKAAVAKAEHKNIAGRNIADIYRMLLFRELMSYLDVISKTAPFPANYASPLSKAQAFFLWLYLIFSESSKGNEDEAEQYLEEGIKELFPLLDEIKTETVIRHFEEERQAWREFISAVDDMDKKDAVKWLESLEIVHN